MHQLNHAHEKRLFNQRLHQLLIVLLILSGALVLRLYYLDIIHFKRYQTLSRNNRITIVPLPPARGLITDRNGLLLAENVPVYDLEVLPDKTVNVDALISQLRKIISLSDNEVMLFKKAIKQHRHYENVPIKFGLTEKELSQFAVNQAFFPDLAITAGLMRHYPHSQTTAHILGYVGRISADDRNLYSSTNYAGTHFVGKVGIEKAYEWQLHGKVGYRHLETDASGRRVRTLKTVAGVNGNNLKLTIDLKLQQAAQKALADLRGAAVAIEPKTGEILAMASTPSYDANDFVKGIDYASYKKLTESPFRPLYNRAIRGQYPLASTIKPFLSLKALDEEVISTNTRIYDPGWFQLTGSSHHFRDWKRGGHGWVDLKHAIVASCDTYFYYLSEKLGIHDIDDILVSFGFGKLTQVDMGEELPGLIPTPQWKKKTKHLPWYRGDTLISGIGQGFMLTTPLQLASATAQLANQGQRFQPHLVKEQQQESNKRSVPPQQVANLTLKQPQIWHFVIDAMENVINDRRGTGFRFGPRPPYRVAAKTGTAQVYSIKQQRQYESEEDVPTYLRDHSLFIAFAPVENPQIAVAVVVENNNLASAVARAIIDNYLQRTQHD